MKKWEDIKPCAHCGGTANVSDWASLTAIDCIDCGACCQGFSTESAISIWNARTTPEGYVLVPVEPTEEMIESTMDGHDELSRCLILDCYDAMIKAAQQPIGRVK